MATLMETDRIKARARPGSIRAIADVRRRERLRVPRPEHQADVSARAQLVLDEVVAKDGRDRHCPPPRPALRSDGALLGVPRALDMDDAGRKVDVLPAQRK